MSIPNLSQLPLVGAVTLVYDPEKPKLFDGTKLRVQYTLGGGDCLYHALAQLANHYRHPDAYKFYKQMMVDVKSFRNAIANEIDKDWQSFKSMHPELQSIDRYKFLNDVRSSRWAGEPEIDAALHLFPGVRIAVWTRNASGQTVLHSLVTPGKDQYTKTWHILMHANHYEWMSQYSQTLKNRSRLMPATSSAASSSASSSTSDSSTKTPLRQLAEAREARQTHPY